MFPFRAGELRFRQRPRVEVLQTTTNGAACKPGDQMDNVQAAPAGRQDLAGCKLAAPPLIELRADRIPTFANRLCVDHASAHAAAGPPRNTLRLGAMRIVGLFDVVSIFE